jgi:hypothetical protein
MLANAGVNTPNRHLDTDWNNMENDQLREDCLTLNQYDNNPLNWVTVM